MLPSLLSVDSVLNVLDVFRQNESKIPVEKFGMPHCKQHQLMLLEPMTLYIWSDIP